MKKEVSKGKKFGLIIAIAAVVLLAVVGVVLALLLGGGQGAEEKLQSKLYWNIDGKSMLSQETAMSTRKPAEDGLFYIRYLVGGEIVEIPFADRKLVTQADRMEISCLKFDADGIAIEVVDPEELYVRIQDKTYVQAIDGNKITTNTSTVLNGMKKQLELPADVPVVNVATRTGKVEVGATVELEIFDQVLIYGTDEETITDIFLTDRYWESEIYWRIGDRIYWDASRKVSTRPLAEDGYWYIDLACKGEVKTYKVAMQDCIDALDSKGPTDAATGVVFDENGAIVNLFNAGLACRGTLQANSYDVTDLSEDGKTFTATRIMFGTEIGKTFTGTITENTQIYNISATAEDHRGEPTQLQLNDRLQVFQAADGSIHTIFVVNRMVDSPFYYNLSRKWSSVTGLTRETDEDGYYVYELAVNGKVKTVRTKDKAIAEQMDGANLSLFGLRLKGDIVTKVYEAVNVAGNWSFSTTNFVQTTEGGILGTVSTTGTAVNGVMAANCEVYDVSNCYKNFRGEKATIREGDQILAYQNAVGEVTHIWILNRYVKGTTIYWNMNRYYANGETTRTPDADGYYVFNCIKAGTTKVVQLKTKDKEVASRFDKEGSTTAAALKVKGDIITAAYPAPAAIGGYYRLAAFWVHELNVNDTLGTHALIARTGAIGNIIMADDCKIMNFSQVINKAAGESTQLKVGDYVWPIAGQDGKIHYLFIIEREVTGSKVAWRKTSLATLKDAEGNVLKDKDGNNMLQADEDGYYVFTLWVNGKIGTYKTKDLKLANYVNTRGAGFAVSVKGNIITGAYPISSEPNTRAASVSYYDYVKITDGVMYLKRNRVGQTDTGNEMTVNVADGYKAYLFDPASGDDWGKQVKLNKGDRVYAYSDNNGESYIFFIMYRCTLDGGNMQYCDHCGKKVHWESIFAGYAPAAGCIPEVAHYYIPTDYATTGFALGNQTQINEGKQTELVINLNGKTVTRKGTLNTASGIVNAPGPLFTANYGNTLIFTDYSKNKTGKLTTEDGTTYNSYGSLVHVTGANVDAGMPASKVIIEGGTFDGSKGIVNYTNANGGTISVGGELVVNGGTIKGRASNGNGSAIGAWGGTSITINGGTLIGNTVKGEINGTGHGGVIATNGNLTINGGTIKGGTAAAGGDNIYVGNPNAEVAFNGGTIDGGIQIDAAKSVKLSGKPQITAGKNYGLKMSSSLKVDATGLKAGAKVYVDASGVFTTEFKSAKAAQDVIDNGMLKAGAEGMMLKVQGKAIASVPDGQIREWTDANSLPDMGRWKLMTDVTITSRMDVTAELYIDLNGHDITRTVASDATAACQVFRVNGGKLTIDDSTGNNGVVSTAYADGQAICDYSAVIHITDTAEFTLEGGIIDGSNVDNTYVNANNGTISVGGKLTVNGGVIKGVKRGSASGGAIGGWASTEIIVNGGKIYAGGSFLQPNGNQKVNGAAIATTGSLVINGGEIIGPGKDSTAEQRARSGGLIYANGDSMIINGGSFVDGFGTGYGFNIYYERNYRGVADPETGVRPTVTGGGEVVIGGDAFIKGGVTIRSSKVEEPVKLTVKDNAMIDDTGAVGAQNIRLYNGELYINAETTPITTAPANANYDVSLVYSCKNAIIGFITGHTVKVDHNYGDDVTCDECGYTNVEVTLSKENLTLTEGAEETLTVIKNPADATVTWTTSDATVATVSDGKITAVKAGTATITVTAAYGEYTATATCNVTVKAESVPGSGMETQPWVEWTDGTKLPKEGKYKLTTNVTTASTTLTGELWLDLNGQTVTCSTANVIITDGHDLLIDDLSGKTGDELGTIKTTATSGSARAAVLYVNAVANRPSTAILNNGIIDGTTFTNTQTGLVSGTVTVGNATNAFPTFTMNGGVIKGQKCSVMTSGVGGSAIGLMNSTHFVMNGGTIYAHSYTSKAANVCCTGSCINAGGASGTNPTSTITINGGTMYAGRAMNHGAAIFTGGNLYMNGGIIYGSQSQNSGAICGNGGAEMVINGGVIIGGNTVATPGNGSAIDKASGVLTIGGNAVIGGGINIRSSAKLVFTGNAMVDSRLGAEQKFDVRINGGSVYLNDTTGTAISTTNGNYKVTYDANGKINGLAAYAATAVTEGTSIPTKGAVKLTEDVTLTEAVVTEGDLYIDLNGKTVTGALAGPAITAKHNVIITDTSAEKTGKIVNTTATMNNTASLVKVENGKNLVLMGGTLDASAVKNSYSGGTAAAVTMGNYAKFVMLGGEIKGQTGTSTSSGTGGSCVAGWGNSTIVIYDGKLTAKNNGSTFPTHQAAATGTCINTTGNVFVHGGELHGTMANTHGANIYCTGNLTITGGLISGGYANNSGLISCSGASCTITGGTLVGGTAHSGSALGGASIDYAKDGGILTIGGNAKIAGGVSIRSKAKLVLTGKAVIDMNMAGQTQKKFNIQIKNGPCSIYLDEATGTALANASSGKWDVAYDAAGNITGITAK